MKILYVCILNSIAAGAAALFAANAFGQAYPSKPIRLIVPFAAGGTTDIIARVIASKAHLHLGQPIVIENLGGAGGVIGANALANSAADGYTLGMATVSTIAAAPAMNPKLPYSPTADFTPIINIAATPNVLLLHPSFPARDYNGFVAELRKLPNKYSYASSGTGGLGYVLMGLFQRKTGTSLVHIPYKGAGPALNDVVAGQVHLMMDNLPSALPFIKAKRLVPIGVASDKRIDAMPEVPTFLELSLPDVNRLAFYGICGPRGLPGQIVSRLHDAFKRTLADPQVLERIADTGSVVIGNSPAEFAEQIRAEFQTFKTIIGMQDVAH